LSFTISNLMSHKQTVNKAINNDNNRHFLMLSWIIRGTLYALNNILKKHSALQEVKYKRHLNGK